MKTLDDARELANVMVAIGKLSGRKVIALISQMDQPLGHAVGNALELKEAIAMLRGTGPDDLHTHCIDLAAYMLLLGHATQDLDQARKMAQKSIADGSAWAKLREMVKVQGGDVSFLDEPTKLPASKFVSPIYADKDGYIKTVDAKEVGESSVMIGAGRAKKDDQIDLAVGIMVHRKVGEKIRNGDLLFEVHVNKESDFDLVFEKLKQAVEICDEPVDPPPCFWDVIGVN